MPRAHKFVQHVATTNVSVLAMDEIAGVTFTAVIIQLMPAAEKRMMYIGVKKLFARSYHLSTHRRLTAKELTGRQEIAKFSPTTPRLATAQWYLL
jgi:hypothetical protein